MDVQASTERQVPRSFTDAGVAAVDRAISLLLAFSETDASLSLSDLASRTGLYKSTILRLMRSLLHFSFMERDNAGRFRIGPNAWRVGVLFTRAVEIQDRLAPLVHELGAKTEESISVYVPVLSPAPPTRVCILRVNSPHALRDHVELGDSLPLGRGGGGRMLRAYVAPEGAEDEKIKDSGYVLSFGERRTGIGSAAAPIFGAGNQLVGSLTISAPMARRQRSWFVAQLPNLIAAAREATMLLGGKRTMATRPLDRVSKRKTPTNRTARDQLRRKNNGTGAKRHRK
ncbi:MAG: IclR family transcriptional regulator [Variibacter sp.]